MNSTTTDILDSMKENEIQQTLDKEQHHSARIIHAHYVKLLALPLCSPTKMTLQCTLSAVADGILFARFKKECRHANKSNVRMSYKCLSKN